MKTNLSPYYYYYPTPQEREAVLPPLLVKMAAEKREENEMKALQKMDGVAMAVSLVTRR